MVRGLGYIKSVDDLKNIAIGKDQSTGTPVYLKDVANVDIGPELRRGIADLDGEGEVGNSEGKHAIKSGDFILINSNERHQIINTGPKTLRFLCIIPHIDDREVDKR